MNEVSLRIGELLGRFQAANKHTTSCVNFHKMQTVVKHRKLTISLFFQNNKHPMRL